MKTQFKFALILLGAAPIVPALLAPQTAHARPADVPVRTPKPGSAERAAILDAVRKPLQKFHKGQRPTFADVHSFRAGGGWVHLSANVVGDDGKPMGEMGELDFSALLKWQKSGWKVVEWSYHGDVVQIGWADKHPNVPLNVLGLKPSDVR